MVGPERGLRPGKDRLWLDMAAVHTRPANRPDIPADAVDAIPMFKDKPASDEEQEQCSRQLNAQVCPSLWLYAHHAAAAVWLGYGRLCSTGNALMLVKYLTCYPTPTHCRGLHLFVAICSSCDCCCLVVPLLFTSNRSCHLFMHLAYPINHYCL